MNAVTRFLIMPFVKEIKTRVLIPIDEIEVNRIPLQKKNGLSVIDDNDAKISNIIKNIILQQKDKMLIRLGFKTISCLYRLWVNRSDMNIGIANPTNP